MLCSSSRTHETQCSGTNSVEKFLEQVQRQQGFVCFSCALQSRHQALIWADPRKLLFPGLHPQVAEWCWGRADAADQNQKSLMGTSLLRMCGCMDCCWCINPHLCICALHSLNFIFKDTAGKRELLESNVTFVVIVCGIGQKAKELLVVDKENIRNYRDRANKNQSRWSRFMSPEHPYLLLLSFLQILVLVTVGFLSFPIHLCRIPSSTESAATGCACNEVNLISSPISGALPHPPGTGAWIRPPGISMWSVASSWQQCLCLPDPTPALPVLSSCCSSFCWSRRVKINFSLGAWL